jgi:NAD(P)-dependent dehydrogenase (short-subunit alcohol dehydrogenase family)
VLSGKVAVVTGGASGIGRGIATRLIGAGMRLVAPQRLGAYAVTKFGVVALTEALAAELAHAGSKVGATVLCPGTVRTNIRSSSRNRPAHLAGGGLADVNVGREENRPRPRCPRPRVPRSGSPTGHAAASGRRK